MSGQERFRAQREIPRDPSGDFLSQSLSRRSFFSRTARATAGAGLVVSGGISLDTFIGDNIWGGTNPELVVLTDEETRRKFPNSYTFTIGGYGVYDLPALTNAVGDTMKQYSQMAYLRPSNDGLHIGDLKRKVDEFVENSKVKDVYLYGHSMGGMLAIELGAHLEQKGVQVNGIILDCSPMNYSDIRETRRDEADILRVTEKLDVRGGPLTRFAIEVAARWTDGRRDVQKICEEALKKIAPNNCSNKLIQSQAEYLSQFDLNNFIDFLNSATQFIYLRPENFTADTTINNQTSLARLRTALPINRIVDQPVIGSAHANPIQCRAAYNEALQTATKACLFDDGTPLLPSHRVI